MSITIDGFEIDATLSEGHDLNAEVTAYPVESGSDVTDHVRLLPITVTLDCVVSDTPIGSLATRRGGFSLPSDDAYAHLVSLRNAREPVTIETSLAVFENMVCTAVSIPRAAENGDSLRFSATFTQIQLITNARTTVRVSVPKAAKKVNLGNRPLSDAPTIDEVAKARGLTTAQLLQQMNP